VNFDDFCEGIWLKVVSRLKEDSLDELRLRRYPYQRLTESVIVSKIPRCLKGLQVKRWTLL
jgi:hypothetical protein